MGADLEEPTYLPSAATCSALPPKRLGLKKKPGENSLNSVLLPAIPKYLKDHWNSSGINLPSLMAEDFFSPSTKGVWLLSCIHTLAPSFLYSQSVRGHKRRLDKGMQN